MDLFYKKLGLASIDFFDIGCSGPLSKKWTSIISFLNYFGFDPNKEECARLSALPHKYKSAKYLPFAIAGEKGEQTMYKTKSIYCYSLLCPNHKWLNRFSYFDLFTLTGKEKVDCHTLDDLTERKEVKADIIKLDTQGMELPILSHAGKILQNAFCVETETGFLENYIGETTYSQIDKFMRAKGFLMFDMNIRSVGRRNHLVNQGRHQPLWCEAIWLYDYIGQNKVCSKETAIKALAICRALRFYDYGFELAGFFKEKGIINSDIFSYLENRNNWALSFAEKMYIKYFPERIRMKVKRKIKRVISLFCL